jgi:hypothetical protein
MRNGGSMKPRGAITAEVQRFTRGLLPSRAHRWGSGLGASLAQGEGKDNMGKRFAILISGVAAAGVMALGAHTVMALVKR